MLVIYDKASGLINHILVHAEPGLDHMKKVYTELGKGTLLNPGGSMNDSVTHYVFDGRIIPRPTVDVVGPGDMSASDLIFHVNQPCELEVSFAGEVVATEALQSGPLPFSVEHPGAYQLRFSAPFPFLDAIFNLEVR
ncbi:hypothetical protein X566_20205 [Afipia sp. P52-10]|uniref:hypothetical protein n=1 Tax=Afipia sp. P52-10 TaxID=1429916 RepID=UPI0003DF3BCC|nr:hypothetical protein [Afipia sp. P52-10]ETR75921.1 hypothetical protein X566_20205 [Afipia sp. P52-10]